MKYYKLTVFTPDRSGLISTIAGALFGAGVNLGDTSFSVLGEGAEFTAVCELPKHLDQNALQQLIACEDGLEDAKVSATLFELNTERSENAKVTHEMALRGADDPGLIARLSETLIGLGANIVRLNANLISIGDERDYLIKIAACIPMGREEACIASIQNTASSLNLEFTSKKVTPNSGG